MGTDETTHDLMVRVQRGDQDAFEMVYGALCARVYGVVRRVVRDPMISEEVTQDVFVEVWCKAARYDASRGSVETWASTIARRRAVDRVRHEQSLHRRVDQLSRQRERSSRCLADVVAGMLDDAAAVRAVHCLPIAQRTVIEMSFLDGQTHRAIADELGLPLGTVKGRVRAGLRQLRVSLMTSCVEHTLPPHRLVS